MYDIFILDNGDDIAFQKLKEKYPLIKKIKGYETLFDGYLLAKKRSLTKMFWIIWPDLKILDSFNFDYEVSKWDQDYIHVFKSEEKYDGVCIIPKHLDLTKREVNYRFFSSKKEINIHSSVQRSFDKFHIENYNDYLRALEKSSTDMFWAIWPNIEILDESIFDLTFSFHDFYDRDENHVWKNLCNDTESYISGLTLFSKKKPVSKREIEYRMLVNRKEHDQSMSRFRYPRYVIDSYERYLEICSKETQPLFWAIWPGIEILDEKIFDTYYDPLDGTYDYDRSENHVWKNLCNDTESYISGLTLFSTQNIVSKREIEYRMLVNRKEHDEVASRFRYPRYTLDSYEEYLKICSTERQPLFWAIWPEVEVLDEKIFDTYYDPLDGTYDYDRSENHVFKNKDVDEIKYNGLMLLSTKKSPVSKKEIDFRYIIDKKEHDILASQLKLYDIVFISYNEPNADENWERLKSKFSKAVRVHGVKGIHQAHIKAASLCTTPMFWVVDGDAKIVDDFDFSLLLPKHDRDIVHVWRSRNPINDLEYGNGGVKLLPRIQTLNVDINSPDMTTSISSKFRAMEQVSNFNMFNTSDFATWRSAFRECVKLASKTIKGQVDEETVSRLNTWCNVGKDKPFGEWSILGAQEGRAYGEKNKDNVEALKNINDFDWLRQEFSKHKKI